MRRKAGVVAAIALTCGLASAGEAKTLTYCAAGIPEGFDPAPYTTPATFDASSQPLYDRLVAFEPGTTRVGPGLAERWEVSDDGLEYTFHLRRGVSFHTTDDFTPSREFNADDVIFTFDRQMNPSDPYFGYAGGQWLYFAGMAMPELLSAVEKIDDDTVKFVLNVPYASFIANLAMDFASIVSKEYADLARAEDRMEDLNRKPVGTGPFQLVAYEENATIRYRANPDYWGGKPAIDDLVFVIAPDGGERRRMLEAGECQVMADPDPDDIAAMKENPDIVVVQQERLDIAYLAYNTTQPPFDNPAVRRALNMAIDKQAIVDTVYGPAGTVAKGPLPPTVWSSNDAIADDPYDPEAARAMLEEAGVSELTMSLWAMQTPRSYNPDARRMAELIRADLAEVGVEAVIVSYEWGEYLRRTAAPDRDGAVLFGWTGDNGDPGSFLAPLLGCDAVGLSNRAQWCDEAFDALILRARTVTDPAERARLYQQAQAIFKEQAPWAPIAHSLATVAMSTSVENYVIDPLGRQNFAAVDVSADAAGGAGEGSSAGPASPASQAGQDGQAGQAPPESPAGVGQGQPAGSDY